MRWWPTGQRSGSPGHTAPDNPSGRLLINVCIECYRIVCLLRCYVCMYVCLSYVVIYRMFVSKTQTGPAMETIENNDNVHT